MHSPVYDLIGYYDNNVPDQFKQLTQYSGVSYACWYIRSGSVEVKTREKTLYATAGEWVFIEPLTMKSHRFSNPSHIISIRFCIFWNNLHFFPPLRPPWKVSGQSHPELAQSAEAFCAFMANAHTAGAQTLPSIHARRSALFSDWLWHWHQLREKHTSNTPPPADKRIGPIVEELMREPGSTPVDYTKLSQVSGLSRSQINRIFKHATGQTPKGWQNTECLRIAERLLQESELSLKEIAAHLHFSDASHFSKWFRKQMNQTPSEWARIQKETSKR